MEVGTIGAIIAATIAALGAFASLAVSIINFRKVDKTHLEIVSTKAGIFEIGKRIDGRLSSLLTITEEAALAKGRLEGQATEQAKTKH